MEDPSFYVLQLESVLGLHSNHEQIDAVVVVSMPPLKDTDYLHVVDDVTVDSYTLESNHTEGVHVH
jgi:hypothetical protein